MRFRTGPAEARRAPALRCRAAFLLTYLTAECGPMGDKPNRVVMGGTAQAETRGATKSEKHNATFYVAVLARISGPVAGVPFWVTRLGTHKTEARATGRPILFLAPLAPKGGQMR